MKSGIINLVNAVHGGGTIEWLPNIYNTYTTDVSKYIIGWAVGTEWYENDVNTTNVNNAGMAPYDGTYVATTSNASPFEIWCAQVNKRKTVLVNYKSMCFLDARLHRDHRHAVQLAATHGPHQLGHDGSDLASSRAHVPHLGRRLDVCRRNPHVHEEQLVRGLLYHVRTTAYIFKKLKTRQTHLLFLRFHAYPYYPAFLNYAYSDYSSLIPDYPAAYPEVITPTDPYATYLERLRAYFDGYAIMITECGMPTSFGTSQFGFHTRDHGHNLEYDAYYKMNGVVTMIYDRRFAGLMYFSLMDEWFKKASYTTKTLLISPPLFSRTGITRRST